VSLSVVYVSWRDTDVLVRALRRLREAVTDGDAVEVIVVVNESVDAPTDVIDSAWPGAIVIANEHNRGFGPACNQGAAVAGNEILLFLNPDTLVEDGALREIQDAFATYPDAVAVAPRLHDAVSSRGETQREFQLRRLPTLRADTREMLLVDRAFPSNSRRWRDRYLDRDRDEPFEVEQAAAAALAVRREAFKAVGGFDERFRPAYWEDVDLCLRLRRAGSIVYWPPARVAHIGGVSVGTLGSRRFRRMYYANALRYRAKHYSKSGVVAYRSLLFLGMALRVVAAPLTSRPGAETRDAVRGFLDVAGMALRRPRRPGDEGQA
jgi:GT2 family glycosyltransferase